MSHIFTKVTKILIATILPFGLIWLWLNVDNLAWAAPSNPAPDSISVPAQSSESPANEDGLTWVSVIAFPDAGVDDFFVGPIYRKTVGDLERIAGRVRAASLPTLANRPGVIRVTDAARPQHVPPESDPAHSGSPPAHSSSGLPAAPASPTSIEGWYENNTQGVRETWNTLGITGSGVTIAVLDSGVDFGNPALAGRYAIQPATAAGTQAYAGWPAAFDDSSLSEYLAEPDRAWPDNWGWFVNASYAISGTGIFTFTDPLNPTDTYTTPGTSLSGQYYLGYHPDTALDKALVMVSDEAAAGQYDAVYLDLDSDGIFETRLSQANPVGTLDIGGDGVTDISAGMLYWIADGSNPPPGAEAVYGSGTPIPAAGRLIAFMIDNLWEFGGGHGTMVASTAVGNDGGVFVPEARVASLYDFATYGPLVQGPAPGAKVMSLGNVYAGGSMDAWYLFTTLGLDGIADTGDEPQIVTMSFGDGEVDNDGWDWESRYLAYLNLTYGEASPLFVHSAGNGGFGYGTQLAPSPATGLNVGAATQFGTLNFLGISETVSLPARVNYGDVSSFSGRGPGADGTRAVDLVANGMTGSGAYPVNGSNDGTSAYVHWSGTSRSVPVVGGMAALTYQAFYQANGRFPTYEEARGLLTNSARDLGYDPLVQGAGQVNAFRAVQVALGQYGVSVSPPVVVAGDWRGENYPAFAAGLSRGESHTLEFEVRNPGLTTVTLELAAQHLVETARYTAALQTLHDTSTNYGAGAPDYALDLTPWVQAHPTANLMVVRMTVPFEHFNSLPPNPPAPKNQWRLMAYNWWDDNSNGDWWTDLNSDGCIDGPEELDGGDEWLRFDYSRVNGTQQEVRVGQPYTRSLGAGSGGIWAGAAHLRRGSEVNATTLQFEVVFYEHAPWDEVTLSANQLTLLGGQQATFQATIQVPPDAPAGFYQGSIVVSDTGRTDIDPVYYPHTSQIPLTWQVWPDLTLGATLGGTSAYSVTTPYDNSRIAGGFNWSSYDESGDWRFYGFDLQDSPEGSIILAHNVWEDYPTDIDTLIFGPVRDEFSAVNPDWFGPYSLDTVGSSLRYGTRPYLVFQTATGDTEEWVAAPTQDGLHILAHQAVLFGGSQAAVPFTTSLGLAQVDPSPLYIDPAVCGFSCTMSLNFQSSIAIPDGLADDFGFGWITPTLLTGSLDSQSVVTHSLTISGAHYRLDFSMQSFEGAQSLNLNLYDDNGSTPRAWDAEDGWLAGSNYLAAGDSWAPQRFVIGGNWLVVTGNAVQPGGGSYTLGFTPFAWVDDGGLTFDGLPAAVAAGQIYTFTVHTARTPRVGQRGLLVFGPSALRTALNVLVIVEPLADLWVEKTGPSEVQSGETFTYTITYGNAGPQDAHGVILTDILPAGITTTQPLFLNVVTLTAGATRTWTMAATVESGAARGVTLTNTVNITSQETDPNPVNNTAQAGLMVLEYRVYLPIVVR